MPRPGGDSRASAKVSGPRSVLKNGVALPVDRRVVMTSKRGSLPSAEVSARSGSENGDTLASLCAQAARPSGRNAARASERHEKARLVTGIETGIRSECEGPNWQPYL